MEKNSADENYFDSRRFAAEGNIGHIVEQIRTYGVGQKQPERLKQKHMKRTIEYWVRNLRH